jgi:hypothetical protein
VVEYLPSMRSPGFDPQHQKKKKAMTTWKSNLKIYYLYLQKSYT